MCVREEDYMAMSLLFALLDVDDRNDLEILAKQYPISDDVKRAIKYSSMTPKQKREVLKELYRALYAITQSSEVNRDLNMAIGKALCNAINGNRQGSLQHDPGIQKLYAVLKPIVVEAIDEI
jgi:hypothetical protein